MTTVYAAPNLPIPAAVAEAVAALEIETARAAVYGRVYV